jgi:hypothetical protein
VGPIAQHPRGLGQSIVANEEPRPSAALLFRLQINVTNHGSRRAIAHGDYIRLVLRQCRNSESICNRVWLRPQRLCVHNLATLVRDDDFSCICCAPIFCQFLGYQSRVPTSCIVIGQFLTLGLRDQRKKISRHYEAVFRSGLGLLLASRTRRSARSLAVRLRIASCLARYSSTAFGASCRWRKRRSARSLSADDMMTTIFLRTHGC